MYHKNCLHFYYIPSYVFLNFLFKNMIQNGIVSAISVDLIKMIILGVGRDGYYVILITIFCLFLTDL